MSAINPMAGVTFIDPDEIDVPNFVSRGRQQALDQNNEARMRALRLLPNGMTTREELNTLDRQDERVARASRARASRARSSKWIVESLYGKGGTALGEASNPTDARMAVHDIAGVLVPGRVRRTDRYSTLTPTEADTLHTLIATQTTALDAADTAKGREADALRSKNDAARENRNALARRTTALRNQDSAISDRDAARRSAAREQRRGNVRSAASYQAEAEHLEGQARQFGLNAQAAWRAYDDGGAATARASQDDAARNARHARRNETRARQRFGNSRSANDYLSAAEGYETEAQGFSRAARNARTDADKWGDSVTGFVKDANSWAAEAQRQARIASDAGASASHMIHSMLHSGQRPPSVSSYGDYEGYADYDPNFPEHTRKYRMELYCDGGSNGGLLATSRTHATISHHEYLLDEHNTYKITDLDVQSDGWLVIKVDVTGRSALSDESLRRTNRERRIRGTA